MSTPGDHRRAQRRAVRKDGPKKQATDLTPLEEAIERKMRSLAREQAPQQTDAKAIAMLVVKHWGDDAPKVLNLATEYARDECGRWAPKTTAGRVPTDGEGDPP